MTMKICQWWCKRAIDRPIGISLIIVLRHDPVPFLRCARSAAPFAARVPDPDLSSHLSGRSCPNCCCSWTWLVTAVPPIQMEFPFPPISVVGCMALQRPPDATHRGISISHCAPCKYTFMLSLATAWQRKETECTHGVIWTALRGFLWLSFCKSWKAIPTWRIALSI